MHRKLNTFTLAGLMVGPILGSGIVLLPPLAYERLGGGALWAWVLVLAVGGAFAGVFVPMALRSKTASGLAELVAREWGAVWGELASNFLTGAVVFGAVPVFLTAARLWPLRAAAPEWVWAAAFLVVTMALLWAGLTTVSRVALVLSTTTAVLLVAGGALALITHPITVPPLPGVGDLGSRLLLLFWAIVGWEVIGNYSNDVDRPEKAIPRAGVLSVIAVSAVYLVTTAALQTLAPASDHPTVATVLEPLVGGAAGWVGGLLAGGLCITTVLMFVGAVARMTDHRARQGALPAWLAGAADKPPRRALAVQTVLSAGLLTLTTSGWVTLEDLVSTANLFFLGNALLGLAAAWKLLPGAGFQVLIVVLAVLLVLLLTQGHPAGWLIFAAVTTVTLVRARRRP